MPKTITEHIRARLLNEKLTLEQIKESQWSNRFEALMRNRMVMGYFRYGSIRDPGTPKYDNVGSAIKRLNLYLESGNTEHLVDAANLCLVEFIRGCCVEKQVWAPEDDGYHTEVLHAQK